MPKRDEVKWIDLQQPAAFTGTSEFAGKQYATYVIAAVDSTPEGRAAADAVCTGVDDDDTINAVLALRGSYVRVLLLEGHYDVSNGSITIDGSNVTLEGQGPATEIFGTAQGSSPAATNHIVVNGSHVRIANMTIRGLNAAELGFEEIGITVNPDCVNVEIASVTIIDLSKHAIKLDTAKRCKVHDCSFLDIWQEDVDFGQDGIAIELADAVECSVTNNVFYTQGEPGVRLGCGIRLSFDCLYCVVSGNRMGDNIRAGIDINGQFHTVSGNIINYSDIGITLRGYYITCTGNTMLKPATGINCNGATYCTITGNIMIAEQTVYGNYGIYLDTAYYNVISNNIITQFDSVGIELFGSSDNIIQGNILTGNSWTDHPSAGSLEPVGMALEDTASRNYIGQNVIRRTIVPPDEELTGTYKQLYGIWVKVVECEDNIVVANDLRWGGTDAGLTDEGSGTITENYE